MLQQSNPIFTAQQTRDLDNLTISKAGISGLSLMHRAGEFTWQVLLNQWQNCQHVLVLCGTGNNGGDGYVIALLAKQAGKQVSIIQLGNVESQSDDALTCRLEMEKNGLTIEKFVGNLPDQVDVIVDAMFGTGLKRAVNGEWFDIIQAINLHSAPVIAVDIPSGLHADSGCILGDAVIADVTTTFIGRKQGLYTNDGKQCCGEIHFSDLGVPDDIYKRIPTNHYCLKPDLSGFAHNKRNKNSHKGNFGHVLVIGGDVGMSGAVTMAACAALRSGCGLVTVATHPDHAALVNVYQPEIMSIGLHNPSDLEKIIHKVDIIVLGPGLGLSSWSENVFATVFKHNVKPLVVDADALNLLSKHHHDVSNAVLTPHPGEAAALLGVSTVDVQKDRFFAVNALQNKYHCAIVLKGAGSLISINKSVYVCIAGNPGMATAGMGDILSGIIASLLAQNRSSLNIDEIVCYAVMLHSLAGDKVAKQNGEKGMLATDLFPQVRALING